MKRLTKLLVWFGLSTSVVHADVTLLLEDSHGRTGGMNPTGHAAIYLSRVCAATPLLLRRCKGGEPGVVISRYHRVGDHDWIAIPLTPYLYAVDGAGDVPASVTPEEVAQLRDRYRRTHLQEIAPDGPGSTMPPGDWIQLVGAAYVRTIYTLGFRTTEQQDDSLIEELNSKSNRNHFNILFHNCADFARHVVNFYYPQAVRRSFLADLGFMTPVQAARRMVRYGKKDPEAEFSIHVIPQVPGTLPRSHPARGVLESLIRSKRYAVPLAPLVVFYPPLGAGMAYAWFVGSHFDANRVAAAAGEQPLEPRAVVTNLDSE